MKPTVLSFCPNCQQVVQAVIEDIKIGKSIVVYLFCRHCNYRYEEVRESRPP